jgi:hypothetical protein
MRDETHDYKGSGMTTLFAVLDILHEAVADCCMKQHRHQEFVELRRAGGQSDPRHPRHYATRKPPAVMKRLAGHPRRNFHFTPTSALWLSVVEELFPITRRNFYRTCRLDEAGEGTF